MKFLDREEVLEKEEEQEQEAQPVEVTADLAEPEVPEVDEARMRALALAYARYLKENDMKPGEPTFVEEEELGIPEIEEEAPEAEETEEAVETEEVTEGEESAEAEEPEVEEEPWAEEAEEAVETEEEIHGIEEIAEVEATAEAEEPGEWIVSGDEPAEPEEAQEAVEAETPDTEEKASDEEASEDKETAGSEEKDPKKKAAEEAKRKAAEEKIRIRNERKAKDREKFLKGDKNPVAGVTNLHDKVQDGVDGAFVSLGRGIVSGAHKISSSYKNTRRGIGAAILITGLLAAAVLIVFDWFTVYEYAYNGKVLGYVNRQEEVTDVLEVAAKNLTSNSSAVADVEFVANQNVTFNPVDSRGKSTDDSDTVVNKLIYMTDIETEAFAIYDGDKVVAIVKDQNDADALLLQTKEELSVPDKGMELVSSDFVNDLAAKPVNVLLGSVQSNQAAQEQMVNGGEMHTYHIVEEGESVTSLAQQFGVETFDIYNEDNSEPVELVEQGDRVCIRNLVSPVSVEMVETGRMKERLEYETIKKESDEYYKGDSFIDQEGQDGIQIFEGTITKVAGEETKREATKEPEIIRKKKDKIIVVGTAERPKTAATGTFIMPIKNYVVTSEWGSRWGRMHEGMDFGAPTGTPIYASDGGKIIKANYWSGHGLCVEVDHGNGVITRYSHCSAVHVSIGDLVYQGQHIADVGNTGHSFGSHLHFEVRVNGSSQNPRNYVNP